MNHKEKQGENATKKLMKEGITRELATGTTMHSPWEMARATEFSGTPESDRLSPAGGEKAETKIKQVEEAVAEA